MKTIGKSKFLYIAVAVLAFAMASCGYSQKNKDQAAQQQAAEQATDSVTVIESETIVVAVDSITPDTAATKNNATAPKKTK